MRLNVGSVKVQLWKKKGFIFKKPLKVLHTYSVELNLDDEGNVEGAMVVDAETDRQWQLVEVRQLRQ